MKKYIQLFTAFLVLILSQPTFTMEDSSIEQPSIQTKNILELIHNEVLVLILSDVLIDAKAIGKATDIYEGLDQIKSFIQAAMKNISLTCSQFLALKPKLIELKPKYLHFYRQLLADQFLEVCQSENEEKGLYPKNDTWINDPLTEEQYYLGRRIARFLLMNNTDSPIVADILDFSSLKDKVSQKLIFITVFYGADVNAQSEDGTITIISATGRGHEETVRLLLMNEANVNITDKRKDTALIRAAQCYEENIARLLLAMGADVNIKNELGNTALIEAVNRNAELIVELLLDTPYINTSTQNLQNKTAKDIANERLLKKLPGAESIVSMLNSHCPVPALKAICLRYIRSDKNRYLGKIYLLPSDLIEQL